MLQNARDHVWESQILFNLHSLELCVKEINNILNPLIYSFYLLLMTALKHDDLLDLFLIFASRPGCA